MCALSRRKLLTIYLFILGTARAGRAGTSITLLEHREVFFLKNA
jgi:hypothetical protein